ncbi:Tetratricopeptide repeat (TPR)-like superfamily protein [Euphorbia peplus]|nr:Tetratricopeptide repeat (TPR)-like superfamily protein [Euphorbia peplus]
MFRGFFTSYTNTNKRLLYNSHVFYSSFSSLPPPQLNYQNALLYKPRHFNQPRILDNHCETSPFYPKPGTSPNVSHWTSFDVYENLVQACQSSSLLKESKQSHLNIFKYGFVCDVFLCNTLINSYARTGDLVSARKLFDQMPDRNGVTWTCLISGYTNNGMTHEACGVFKSMILEGCMPNRFAFCGVLQACQDLQLGMQIHGFIFKTPCANDVVLSNKLISVYGNTFGSVDYARRVFDEMHITNSVSCNSIISVYSQKGYTMCAFEIFSSMQQEDAGLDFKPNEYTFGSLITAAGSATGSHLLEQMLASVKKSGFLSDLYVGSSLISGFSKFGLFDYAKKILEQMSVRNAVSINGLMVGLVRQKCGEDAAKVFIETRNLVDINHDTYVVLLSAFAEFGQLEEGVKKGREVHGYTIRTGLNDVKVAIGNGLINMYAKCGAIDDARLVFRHMGVRDSVSWNSMISVLDQNECFEDAIKYYREMRRNGLTASNFTMISTLSSCASLGSIVLGQQIHNEVLKFGLDLDVSVSNSLLAVYAETRYLSECLKVFSLMLGYDQVSWNTMIGAMADSDVPFSRAVEYFLEMMRGGWSPNRVTFLSILAAAVSSLPQNGLSEQIHALMLKHHIAEDTAIENALLFCYGKSGAVDYCEKIFSKMSDRRDEISWNSMISGYIHNGVLPKAMDLVWFMMQRGQQLDCFTFATVLSACASVATLERGMEVHACAVRGCLESDVVVGSALVDMYSKCGRIDYASRFFELMPVRNVYSWNSMISGFARHGFGGKALKLFTQMKLDNQVPDHVTFVGVLTACSHAGLVDEGFGHFKSMTDTYGLAPKIEHYSCMVDLLGRAGKLDKIEKFINEMPMNPNVLIWRTVLGACSQANGSKTELGRRAAEMLLSVEPQNAVNYVLLSNMYASGGKWEEMAKARRAMREAEVKKEAGCTWVTMKDGVHVFVAGDKKHPERELIYGKLKELNEKIRLAGYVPETKFALYDLDSESKEELLSYHSEKLAIAFVLTRNSGLPIRIMKNLRVCGDCHSFFKYISKTVGRQIVLRDSSRFHHFEDGNCSCRDYW